jgi:hypothetical protein
MRLDYLSCVLTIASTVLIGRQMWQGWIVTGVNSIILCIIGIKTQQFGLIPANLFCLAMYGYNVFTWRTAMKSGAAEIPAKHSLENRARRASGRLRGSIVDEQSSSNQHRVRQRVLPGRW